MVLIVNTNTFGKVRGGGTDSDKVKKWVELEKFEKVSGKRVAFQPFSVCRLDPILFAILNLVEALRWDWGWVVRVRVEYLRVSTPSPSI